VFNRKPIAAKQYLAPDKRSHTLNFISTIPATTISQRTFSIKTECMVRLTKKNRLPASSSELPNDDQCSAKRCRLSQLVNCGEPRRNLASQSVTYGGVWYANSIMLGPMTGTRLTMESTLDRVKSRFTTSASIETVHVSITCRALWVYVPIRPYNCIPFRISIPNLVLSTPETLLI